jgi:Magnesium chelatase, subunit ChlI
MEGIDLHPSIVEDLLLRRASISDRTTIGKMANDLCLHPNVVNQAFQNLRDRNFFEVLHLEGLGNYHFTLTDAGRDRVRGVFERSGYIGPAPVTMTTYTEIVGWLRTEVEVSDEQLRSRFNDLVLNPKIVDDLGAAFAGQRSILLWGPAGTGKTSLAERLVRLYGDWILVPYAVETDGAVIGVFDPSIHVPVETEIPDLDPRWVICERPLVMAGGELELSMLQLQRDPVTKVYSAPLQMKANNGILLIDDFGRQMIEPGALLNRWIIPLERRIDFLSLSSGQKFPVPFEVLVVFSTNLDPRDLGDDAFFRRIQNKIYIGAATPEEFDEILNRAAKHFEVDLPDGAHESVRRKLKEVGNRGLSACYPVDLVRLVRNVADYRKTPRIMTDAMIDQAASLYFTSGTEAAIKGVFTKK